MMRRLENRCEKQTICNLTMVDMLCILLLCAAIIPVRICWAGESEVLTDQQGGDVETILSTLNDTLKENKLLRDNMMTLQQGIDRVTVENNVMRTQIRNLEKKLQAAEMKQTSGMDELKRQQDMNKQFETEKTKIQAKVDATQEELARALEKNKELQKVLDSAILEEERDEYRSLILQAQESADHALAKLSETENENEKMKVELEEIYLQVGNAMYEEKNYEGAIKQYKRVIEINPSNANAHHNLAVIYDFYKNEHSLAIDHYEKFLKLSPADETANQIRERILDIELVKNMVPPQPLKMEFNEYHRKK